MVSGSRYLAHHAAKAKEINDMLKPFGFVPIWLERGHYGFWCREIKKLRLTGRSLGCIACGYKYFCQPSPPPLSRNINIEAELKRGKAPMGDWGLNALWHGWRSRSLSHPELFQNRTKEEDEPQYDLPPELDALLGWGYRNLDEIRKNDR